MKGSRRSAKMKGHKPPAFRVRPSPLHLKAHIHTPAEAFLLMWRLDAGVVPRRLVDVTFASRVHSSGVTFALHASWRRTNIFHLQSHCDCTDCHGLCARHLRMIATSCVKSKSRIAADNVTTKTSPTPGRECVHACVCVNKGQWD